MLFSCLYHVYTLGEGGTCISGQFQGLPAAILSSLLPVLRSFPAGWYGSSFKKHPALKYPLGSSFMSYVLRSFFPSQKKLPHNCENCLQTKFIKIQIQRTEEIAQRLRIHAVLAEGQGSILSTHRSAQDHLCLWCQGT